MAAEAVLSAVLKELLSKLSSLVQNEIGLLWGLEEDKKKLDRNLSVIRAVLHDAEKRQVNQMAVKNWLGILKDAAYDAEDLVDEFIFEARRRKVVNQQGMRKKVHNFCSLSNPLVFRTKMAHKMQELRKRFDGIAEERIAFNFKVEDVESRPPISRTRETCSYVIESEVFGRNDEKEKLIYSLINSGDEEVLSVIPIVGMGGLGKTTLAQLIFNDEGLGTHFDLKMWVYVSEDFDVGRLLKEILQSAIEHEVGNLTIDMLHARLRETLSGKKYLLVLDDVWNEEVNEWSRLKTWLKCGGMGSKILATTRSDNVAAIMGTLPAHKLVILSEEDSWTLFETLARPHPNFVSMGKEMVGKCGGLPLAIKTLGGLMSSKTTQSEWESVRTSEFWNPQDNDGGVLPALRLSYDHLTPSLKQCFAYCAIIPKGRGVEKDKLIRQWIAQGFIHSDGENDLLEEKGEGYFNELLQRSLFHVGAKTYHLYNMHDLIHDLLRFIVGAEYSIVEASMKIDPSEIRHLSSQDWNEQRELKILEALKICKKLRTVSLRRYSFDVTVLSRLRCLRVLDFSHSTIRCLPNSMHKLKHLRYLDVSYTLMEELPESICNLHCLQTLNLWRTNIKDLPKNMKKMISLRHVEFNHDYPAPKGIGELTCLRTWPTFVVSEESGAGIEELKSLNQLSGHIHIKGLDNIRNGVCAREANLKAKQYLSALELSWSHVDTVAHIEENSEKVIENLEPHLNVKRLIVNNYMGLKLGWMMILTNLVDIKLSGCKRCEHLPPLWDLPLLESLEMAGLSDLKYIVEFDGDRNCKDVFPALKRLSLDDMRNLEEWSSHATKGGRQGKERDRQVILKSLRNLCICDCPKLIQLLWLRLLPSIKYLEIARVRWDVIEMPTSPSSLRELIVSDMPNLERWFPQEADGDKGNQVIFHSLGTLKINECPKLVCLPGVLLSAPREADHEHVTFPQLMQLEVKNCPRIVHFPHLLPSLRILSVAAINQTLLGSVANYTSLTQLFIQGFPAVKCLPEELGPNHGVLHDFRIRDCPKLMSVSNQLENLHALKTLVIDGCTDLVLSLPDGGLQHHQQQQSPPPLNSLEMLRNLTRLEIDDCPKVFSFLSLENLKSLKCLEISRCPDVMNLLQHAESLTSLTWLTIRNCPWLTIRNCPGMSFLPESMGYLTSLTRLDIRNCLGMSSLPESMGDLTSLTILDISDCPELTTLPEGLQRLTNLRSLYINGCPILKKRLQCNEGQDWHKVAHVPKIRIDRQDPRDSLSLVGHPSLMHSLKMRCNIFNTKKLLLPSCC